MFNIRRKHVREHRSQKHEIEGAVCKRERVSRGTLFSSRVIHFVVNVTPLEMEIWVSGSNFRSAPLDSISGNAQSPVLALWRQKAGQGDSHSSHSTANI